MVHITVNHQKQYEKMTTLTNGWTLIFGLGVGATLLMDLWSAVLRRMGIATLNYAMLGRWCLHWRNGIWFHKSVKEAQPMGGENVVGWTLHYLTGICRELLSRRYLCSLQGASG